MQWIETYMCVLALLESSSCWDASDPSTRLRRNQPEVRKELGASPDRDFESCNMQINQAFQLNGDVAHNTAGLIPELLDAGIRFLIYAGSADFMCNSK